MVLAELIGAVILALSIAYVYFKYVIFNFWHKKGVFYVEPVVPIGSVTDLVTGKAQLGVFFHDAYMKYKHHRAFGMYVFYKPNLVITDPELIRTVLAKEFESFHDRGLYCNEKIDPLTGHLFLIPGKKWRNLRIKLTPTFTPGKIKQMFPILKECGEELTKYMESKAQMRESVEIRDILARYLIDVVMSTAFGVKSNCIKESNNEYIIHAKKVFEQNPIWIALYMFTPRIVDFFSLPLTDRETSSFYMNVLRKSIELRQAHNIVRHDFIDMLIQLMERGYVDSDENKTTHESLTTKKFTMGEAAAQSYLFILAGFESSSLIATYALYELSQYQDVQDKARKEIDEMLSKHGGLTYDALNEMTYLQNIINETMRKYPPLPILNRVCTKEINLPTTNISVPKGTLVTIPLLGLQRDPSIYPDPDKFDPERFNADKIKERHPYSFIPFGHGPRYCIGAQFAFVQIKVGLVSLLSKYKFKLHPDTQIPIIFDERSAILIPKDEICFIIEPRYNNGTLI